MALAIWVLIVATGMAWLYAYSNTAGIHREIPKTYPLRGSREQPAGRLLLFLHPRCPCGRATVDQLMGLIPYVDRSMVVEAIVYRPGSEHDDWTDTGIVKSLLRTSAVKLSIDPAGKRADSFGVSTSGHVLYYAADGQLVFSGGISNGRGHTGDNVGSENLRNILRGDRPSEPIQLPVFGCGLQELDS